MTIRLLAGDARDILPTLPADSVHCVVTSPPYFGLRDYGTAQWDGGDAQCDHKPPLRCRSSKSTLDQGEDYAAMTFSAYRDTCGKCGARRVDRQIGLEASPDEYLATMVAVFREVRRVLRPDGTCWVNIGDSYASSGPRGHGGWDGNNKNPDGTPRLSRQAGDSWGGPTAVGGYKPKDLLLMPARLALALQADGWWVRSEITWCKKNPMPESVRDRPTNATEKIYLLTKNKTYFYDAIATREFPGEPGVIEGTDFLNQGVVLGLDFRAKHHSSERTLAPSGMPHDRRFFEDAIKCATTILQTAQREQQFGLFSFDAEKREQSGDDGSGSLVGCPPDEHGIAALAARFLAGDMAPKSFLHEIDRLALGLAKSDVLGIGGGAIERLHAPSIYGNGNAAITVDNASEVSQDDFARHEQEYAAQSTTASRNMRNYWLMSTHAYSAAHFATFPPELASRCIRAGTSERGCCAQCGAPWVRRTERNLDNVPTRMATKRAPVDCEAVAAYLRERREAMGLSRTAVDAALGTRTLYSWFEGRPAGIEPPTPEQWTKLKEVLQLDVRFDEQINGTVEVVITDHSPSKAAGVRTYAKAWNSETTTTGWSPSCGHDAPIVPATVLDPFFGAGTTGLVADRLGRDCIGIDLNPDYNAMSRARIEDDAPLFAQFPVTDPADERMADLFADDEYQRPGKSQTTPRHDGNRWNENNGRGFKPRMPLAAD